MRVFDVSVSDNMICVSNANDGNNIISISGRGSR